MNQPLDEQMNIKAKEMWKTAKIPLQNIGNKTGVHISNLVRLLCIPTGSLIKLLYLYM
jgi:hypothetical protein